MNGEARPREELPPYNPWAGLGLLPIAAFLIMLEIADARAAIGVSLAVALGVFYIQQRAETGGGLIFKLALLGLATMIGSSIAGLVLDSERIFLWQDPIGDFSIAALLLLALTFSWPLTGRVICELFPRVAAVLEPGHRVFVLVSLIFLFENLAMGLIRVWLLEGTEISSAQYALFSRAVAWPLRAVLALASYWLIRRAMRAELLSAARSGSGEAVGQAELGE